MNQQDPFVGSVIDGRYEIQARIGEGGMGVVYKAKQISIDRVIAIKMLNAQMAGDPNWVQRFYNEAKACSRLQHPNTIRMFDFGQSGDGRLFMTMEYLDGISLRQAVSQGAMTPQRVVKILIQCCASLAEAHSIGIIHRDIKPDNVFLLNMAGSSDFVKLLDFSVAKLLQEGDKMSTQAGVVFGTPQYMSPEQGRGLPLDARSDLYALGILAYEMLTAMVPFHDDNPMTVIQMHLRAEVPPMAQSVPYSVQQIVRRALEKDASRRYQSAGEMMQHCQQVFAELNQGGGSIGAGGMPKTHFAPPPGPQAGMPSHMQGTPMPGRLMQPQMPAQAMQQQPQMPPQMQPQMPPQQQYGGLASPTPEQAASQYVPASHLQKTMIAAPSPFANGNMPQEIQDHLRAQGLPSPNQQVAGTLLGTGAPMQHAPSHGPFIQASPQQKTIMHNVGQPMAQQPMGQPMGPPLAVGPGGYPMAMGQPGDMGSGQNRTVLLAPSDGIVSVARSQPQVIQGASTLFWIVSLLTGIAVGALAYVIVLQL